MAIGHIGWSWQAEALAKPASQWKTQAGTGQPTQANG